MAVEDAKTVANKIGYPILMRPSYVIGGQGMVILHNENQLSDYLTNLQANAQGNRIFPLLIDRYIEGYEIEIDAICDGSDILIPGIFEHVEKAGVHSGDSVAIFPAPNLTSEWKQTIELYAQKISKALNVKGIMNIQFVLSPDRQTLYVLEVNPRASRTVPIASKVTGVPMVDLATRVQMGESLSDQDWQLGLHEDVPYYAVKMPVFSTNKLPGVDPILGPEMKSTGEAIGLGSTVDQAMAKAFGWKADTLKSLTKKDTIFLSLTKIDPTLMKELQSLNLSVEADAITAELLAEQGMTVTEIMDIATAEQNCLDDKYIFIVDTHRTGEKDQHVTLREAALRSDTIHFTSNDTLTAYLKASNVSLEAPKSIQEYRQGEPDLNKKERAIR